VKHEVKCEVKHEVKCEVKCEVNNFAFDAKAAKLTAIYTEIKSDLIVFLSN
jgi:hypothetical protein